MLIVFSFKSKVVKTEGYDLFFGITSSDLDCDHLHGIGNGELNVGSDMSFPTTKSFPVIYLRAERGAMVTNVLPIVFF